MRVTHQEKGFTLLELSIVLVVIGLIVGGVLFGREMIRNAEIRSTVADIEKVQSAINAFRLKYKALPGDMVNGAALFSGARSGNGNFLIEDGSLANGVVVESLEIWNHLSLAQLLNGKSTSFADYAAFFAVAYPDSTNFLATDSISPKVAIKSYIHIGYLAAQSANVPLGHYLSVRKAIFPDILSATTDTYANNCLSGTASSCIYLTTADAFAIDQKLDDGIPNKGKVLTTDANDGCGAAHSSYDLTLTNASCPIVIRASGF